MVRAELRAGTPLVPFCLALEPSQRLPSAGIRPTRRRNVSRGPPLPDTGSSPSSPSRMPLRTHRCEPSVYVDSSTHAVDGSPISLSYHASATPITPLRDTPHNPWITSAAAIVHVTLPATPLYLVTLCLFSRLRIPRNPRNPTRWQGADGSGPDRWPDRDSPSALFWHPARGKRMGEASHPGPRAVQQGDDQALTHPAQPV